MEVDGPYSEAEKQEIKSFDRCLEGLQDIRRK